MKLLAPFFTGLLFLSTLSVKAYGADGSSGCGPGWYIAKDNSLLSSSVRATTNGILSPVVTIGMTVGTSNCTKHSIVKLEKEHLKFANENFYEIAAESAKGTGAFLTTFAELMGCKSDTINLFNQQMKTHFPVLFRWEGDSAKTLIFETYKMILQNPTLKQACFSV
ncbi:MAG: DUF3015 family protein [Bacteriovoracaceae bacterium]|nr:DUF3015 family protein [Bacteriovoracaceae bacterium]